jgi:ElaB/YqjD/DUF883 family membrane-anchored ribosome-binding protein
MPEREVIKEKLVSDFKEVISDAEALLRVTADDISDRAKEARAKLNVKLDEAKVQLKDLDAVVREKAAIGAKETDRIIREHPYESLGVAFGIGLLIGILINRK